MARSIPVCWTLALLGPTIASVACSQPGARAQGAIRDSAGVQLVLNRDDVEPPRWTVPAEPRLVIGAEMGEVRFGLIAGVVRLDDGTIAVADALAREVRFFDSGGELIARAGRRGEGPGEFESIGRMWRVDGSHIAAWDDRLGRYTVLTGDGAVIETTGLELTAERARHTPVGWLPDGRLLAQSNSRVLPSLDYYRADLTLLTFAADGSVGDSLVSIPGVEMWDWVWEAGMTPARIPFGKTTSVATSGSHVWVGANEGYQVDRYDAQGSLNLRARLDRPPARLTAARVAAYQDEERGKAESSAISKGGNELFGRMAEAAPYPDELPHYVDLLADDEGRVWVRDYPANPDAQTRLTVFGPDGLLLGGARLPARFRPTMIGEEFVLGVWRDELDVEHVRLYDLLEVEPRGPDDGSTSPE